MANEKNLIPQAHKLTVEEASRGRKKISRSKSRKENVKRFIRRGIIKENKDRK